MNRKYTALTLITVILAALFASNPANAASGLYKNPSCVIVCGTDLAKGGTDSASGCRYEAESATLYLNNARLTSAFTLSNPKNSALAGRSVCVYADGSLNIVLDGGKNTIGSLESGNNDYAVIIDNGNLNITSANKTATLSVAADSTSNESIAVYVSCTQTSELCCLKIENTDINITSGFACLYATGNVIINGSIVSAKAQGGFCIGANCGNVKLMNSRFTLNAKTYAVYSGNGLNKNSSLEISGCDIKAVSPGQDTYINLIEALGDILVNKSKLELKLTGNVEGSAVFSYNGSINFTDTSFDMQSCGYGILSACGNINFTGQTNGAVKAYSHAACAHGVIGFDLSEKGGVSVRTQEHDGTALISESAIMINGKNKNNISLPKMGKAEKIGSAWYITDKNGNTVNSISIGDVSGFSTKGLLTFLVLSTFILAISVLAIKHKKTPPPLTRCAKRHRVKMRESDTEQSYKIIH